MANISISDKSTKTEIMTFLKDAYKEVAKLDKALAKTIEYASDKFKKDAKTVTKAELTDLAQQVMKLTETITKPVEASSKLGDKSTPLASIFPPELEINDLKFVAVPFKYQTMDEIRKAVKEDEKYRKDLFFATYWTKRLIKQYDYVNMFELKKMTNEDVINELQNDLDIMPVRIVLDTEDTIVAVSAYTEAICLFKGEDLKTVEDVDNDGNKYVLRFSNGMEFQIYELVKETDNSIETEEEERETSEKEEDKEPQQPKDEETTGHKKKFSSRGKKTADEVSTDNKIDDKKTSANTAE